MNEKIVEMVKLSVFEAYRPRDTDLAPLAMQPEEFQKYIGHIAIAAIESYEAALEDIGMVIVPIPRENQIAGMNAESDATQKWIDKISTILQKRARLAERKLKM